MFKLDSKNVIKIIQGDTGILKVTIDEYYLSNGDEIVFTVIDKNPLRTIIEKRINTFTPEGSAIIELEPDDTRELDLKTYYYDIQFTGIDGRVDTIVPYNKFVVLEGISK